MARLDIKGGISCLSIVILLYLLTMFIERAHSEDIDIYWGSTLYEDPKAQRIGDLVTVLIVEDSKAEQSSLTERGKSANVEVSSSGMLSKIPGMAGAGQTGYKGDLKTQRETEVKATLTATVTSIYPNGNLHIEGRKTAVVNGERLEVSVSGVVRRDDIEMGNVITSDFIADSHIVYKGEKKKGFWRMWTKVLLFPFKIFEPLF